MTKTRKVRTLIAATALCCIGLFTTCKNNIGLGSTIDVTPPEIKSVYPPLGVVIKNSFTLSVEAQDDTTVQSVPIVPGGNFRNPSVFFRLSSKKIKRIGKRP